MSASPRALSLAWIALCAVLRASAAAAQPAAPPDSDPRVAEARAHFEEGVELLRRDAWLDALGEFLRSRELYPTAKATTNAVICLRRLGREDEALELLEALLRESPSLPPETQAAVEGEISDLRALVGTIAIEGDEPGATIEIDGRARGALPAPGPRYVRPGSHTVRVVREGYLPFERQVEVSAGQMIQVVISLRPEVAPAPAPAPPRAVPGRGAPRTDPPADLLRHRFSLEAEGALLLVPSFGGDIASGCDGGCTRSPGIGGSVVLRGGYALLPNFTMGLAVGFLGATQTLTGRSMTLQPVGLDPSAGEVTDTLTLQGVLAGAWASVRFGEPTFIELRLGAGAVFGWIDDVRTGTFRSNDGNHYSIGPIGSAVSAPFFHLAPEVRVGLRVTERIDLMAGVGATLLFGAPAPEWGASRLFDARDDGTATFEEESLAGSVVLALAPGLGARYAF